VSFNTAMLLELYPKQSTKNTQTPFTVGDKEISPSKNAMLMWVIKNVQVCRWMERYLTMNYIKNTSRGIWFYLNKNTSRRIYIIILKEIISGSWTYHFYVFIYIFSNPWYKNENELFNTVHFLIFQEESELKRH
jgi:hypothetical protein